MFLYYVFAMFLKYTYVSPHMHVYKYMYYLHTYIVEGADLGVNSTSTYYLLGDLQ